jgi:AcrR family transcriptional regulator
LKESTRDAILEAAAAEFSEHGLSGARMENIAKRSGFNKALLYRHFKDKQGLFEEALRTQFSGRRAILQQLPETLPEILSAWFSQTTADPNFMRLIQREALQFQGEELVESEARREYYQMQIEMLRRFQEQGIVTDELPAMPLFFALLSLVVFPSTFPQITELVSGHPVQSPEFQAEWSDFLQRLARQLRPHSASSDSP